MVKDALYDWMKSLAFFYFLFSVFLHLVPDPSYEKYIRFFMGLLLIFLLSTPLLSFLGNGREFLESFSVFYLEEEMLLQEKTMGNTGEEYWKRSCEEEIERRVQTALSGNGNTSAVFAITVDAGKQTLQIELDEEESEARKAEILDVLERKCGITPEAYSITITFRQS